MVESDNSGFRSHSALCQLWDLFNSCELQFPHRLNGDDYYGVWEMIKWDI